MARNFNSTRRSRLLGYLDSRSSVETRWIDHRSEPRNRTTARNCATRTRRLSIPNSGCGPIDERPRKRRYWTVTNPSATIQPAIEHRQRPAIAPTRRPQNRTTAPNCATQTRTIWPSIPVPADSNVSYPQRPPTRVRRLPGTAPAVGGYDFRQLDRGAEGTPREASFLADRIDRVRYLHNRPGRFTGFERRRPDCSGTHRDAQLALRPATMLL